MLSPWASHKLTVSLLRFFSLPVIDLKFSWASDLSVRRLRAVTCRPAAEPQPRGAAPWDGALGGRGRKWGSGKGLPCRVALGLGWRVSSGRTPLPSHRSWPGTGEAAPSAALCGHVWPGRGRGRGWLCTRRLEPRP